MDLTQFQVIVLLATTACVGVVVGGLVPHWYYAWIRAAPHPVPLVQRIGMTAILLIVAAALTFVIADIVLKFAL